MKIGLITEGTYPAVTGGVSTWCDQLVSGLSEHEFDIVALTGSRADQSVWEMPDNVRSVRLIPVWGPPVAALRPGSRRRSLVESTQQALVQLWDTALGSDDSDPVARMSEALQHLVGISDAVGLARTLASRGSVAPILNAWERQTNGSGAPRMSVADAVLAASIVDRALAVVDHCMAEVDVLHATSNGSAALLALAQSWRYGTPILLTEHGVYLRERYLALHGANVSWPVRRAVTAFHRRLCQVVHAQAHMVLPVNQFNARWERRLGADPDRIFTIPNGVDPAIFTPVTSEPDVSTVSFVGRIDPLKDLETLITAFASVRARIPNAQLRLFGPTPTTNASYKKRLVELASTTGVSGAVHWEGPSKGSRPAIEAGHVVALSSVSEGLPFTLIEAMMCGRATVNTDVGGVAECLDEQQTTGRLVPAKDPEAFADACVELLTDRESRALMGAAARRRALSEFTLDRCLDRYRAAYTATHDRRLLSQARSADAEVIPIEARHADEPVMELSA